MKRNKFVGSFIYIGLICLVSYAYPGGAMDTNREIGPMPITKHLETVEKLYPDSRQVIVVSGREASGLDARLFACERYKNGWITVLGPIDATIGRAGVAPLGLKREGDGKTPQGIYPLGFVFGSGPKVASAMPYRRMTRDNVWVDDPTSANYNHLAKRVETRAGSFEEMILSDNRYTLGIVIEYNTHPVIPGHGSAIFLHIRKDAKTTTTGCIAVSEKDILSVLSWLDPAKKPVISLGTNITI